jgi:hypothetical protein
MRRAALWLVVMIALPGAALAQTDEIQVYDASIADVGQWDVELHSNYTPIGRPTADYPRGIVPEHAWNGVPEFAYGVTEWFEAGLYLPVYTIRNDGRAELDSGKIRALFVSPYAATRTLFYGINFELSYNAAHWEQTRFSGEIRPILGLHLGSWDLIVNPIFDTDFHGLGKLDFAPSERIAYNMTPIWAVAIEQYSDFGQLAYLRAVDQQAQSLFAVVDYHEEDAESVEFGIGHGFTAGSDGLVVKLILGMDF